MRKTLAKAACKTATATAFALLLVIAPLLFGTSSTAEAATQPGYNGKLLYNSNAGGNWEIYIADAMGSNPVNLTNDESADTSPRWSPDGTKITFLSNRDGGNSEYYIMDADGSNVTQLTETTSNNYDLTWSPDGSAFIFRSGGNLYVINADGSNQTNITNSSGVNLYPQWSPDSSKVVFQSTRDGNNEIYVIDADGSNQTRLTDASGNDTNPSWSPDGSKILFMSSRDGGSEVYIMDANGSNQTRLTNNTAYDGTPSWSPNGSEIIFVSNRDDGDMEIYAMNPDGSSQTNLTNNFGYHEERYSILLDGSIAVFSVDWSTYDNTSLFVIDADGAKQTYPLASAGVHQIVTSPIVSPSSTHVMFEGYDIDWNKIGIFIANINTGEIVHAITDSSARNPGGWQPLPNLPPTTTGDSASAPFNTPTLVDVLANDTDEEALDGAKLSIVSQPAHGAASVVGGKIQYTPAASYTGSDSLTYQICDSFLLDQQCATGIVSITVAPLSLAVTNVNGEHFNTGINKYTTSNLRPTFSGTATPGSEIRVEIHSDPIVLTTTADSDGNWSVTPTFDLPAGEHMVYVTATLAGFTTEMEGFGLSVGTLARTGDDLMVVLMGGAMALGVGLCVLWLLYRQDTATKP